MLTTTNSPGYEENVDNVVKHARFEEDWNELVSVKDIDFYSLCEHHLIPFYGKVGSDIDAGSRLVFC